MFFPVLAVWQIALILFVRDLGNLHDWGAEAGLADRPSRVQRVFVCENLVLAGALFPGENLVLVNEIFLRLFSHFSF